MLLVVRMFDIPVFPLLQPRHNYANHFGHSGVTAE